MRSPPVRSFGDDGPTLTGLLLRLLVNAAALAFAAWLLPGIVVEDARSLIVAALIFGVANTLVKPLLVLLTCPLILLTLGLFLIVINAALLGLTSWVADRVDIGFRVESVGAALLGALIVSLTSWVLERVTKP